MLLHIIGGDWIWLRYWRNPPTTPAAVEDLRNQRDASLSPNTFPDLDAVRAKWAEIEEDQIRFVNRVSDEDLEQTLPFRGKEIKLVLLMQHLANHSTYHRGQVSLAIRQLGAEPLATDFHVFLLDDSREAHVSQHCQ
jgi:uncharacterized damage-inducible protein DinB